MSFNSKMTAIADEVRTLSGATGTMGLDAMASTLNTENASFFSNLETQDNLIAQIQSALEGKAAGGGDSGTETATVTVTINAPLDTGNETMYYLAANEWRSLYLGSIEMNSATITCTVPSIIAIDSANLPFAPSLGITKLANSAYYVTGTGSLYYDGHSGGEAP